MAIQHATGNNIAAKEIVRKIYNIMAKKSHNEERTNPVILLIGLVNVCTLLS
jgi:hypothetical protein